MQVVPWVVVHTYISTYAYNIYILYPTSESAVGGYGMGHGGSLNSPAALGVGTDLRELAIAQVLDIADETHTPLPVRHTICTQYVSYREGSLT